MLKTVFCRGQSLYETIVRVPLLSLDFSLHSISIAIHNLFYISMLEMSHNEATRGIVVKLTVYVES